MQYFDIQILNASVKKYYYLDGMIQENTMHCLPHSIHPTKREREVRHAPTNSGSWQILLHDKKKSKFCKLSSIDITRGNIYFSKSKLHKELSFFITLMSLVAMMKSTP